MMIISLSRLTVVSSENETKCQAFMMQNCILQASTPFPCLTWFLILFFPKWSHHHNIWQERKREIMTHILINLFSNFNGKNDCTATVISIIITSSGLSPSPSSQLLFLLLELWSLNPALISFWDGHLEWNMEWKMEWKETDRKSVV